MPKSIATRDDSTTFVLTDRHGSQLVTVAVKTLDEIVSSGGAGIPDMVKIDAEGFDLKVLPGASTLLGKTDVFLAEADVCGNYENSVAEVIQFMANAGYRLIDITDLARSPKHGVLWLCGARLPP
jgi:methyltransferase FkbM-like protein